MAAGFARHFGEGRVEVFSGGTEPARTANPVAVAAMAELGIDISSTPPRTWTDEMVEAADAVVTMGCGDVCPVPPGKIREDWPVDDPEGLGVSAIRPIRDEIGRRVDDLLGRLIARGGEK